MHNTRKTRHKKILIISLTLKTASLTPDFAAHNSTPAIATVTSLNDYQPHNTKPVSVSVLTARTQSLTSFRSSQHPPGTAGNSWLRYIHCNVRLGHKTRPLSLPIWHVVYNAARNEYPSRPPQYSCCSRLVVQIRNGIIQKRQLSCVTEHFGDGRVIGLESGRVGDHFPDCKKCFSFQTC